MKLTVYFDGQYWVGVVEQQEAGHLKASRYIFGAEPKDGEVQLFVLHQIHSLLDATQQTIQVETPSQQRVNPKRLARQVAKEMKSSGVSTRAQEAIKLELSRRKKEKKVVGRQRLLEIQEKKWQQKVQKAKRKHRGR
ncbi:MULTISPECIES: YjdF family protein [Brevibacillus]|uniref:YjdF family protein n=1 Tax=Brevibacillus TaxID=55080 RepID=UPI000D0E8CCD|nr:MULTISPECIES: YjdF family protein [Brevibacillus]PSJ68256.1 DUF2992 domain-containing protein [Brevibacillus brevis]RED35771.1 DUF2992 family protein [Brevibacillus brevis]TQK53453.1 DUF2992 family protein [Brevibacillus sp. AG162]VEF89119.1 Protein of uncharacterised function (DUF2992) [Brevibacillus brevis]GEC89313.1 hypothetical protein BBR01nite_16440 [Brevibacillus brevis]